MADSSVSITAGTGTSIDTRTESTNGNHRQVVILGDPSTNDGVAPVDATAGLKVNLGADNDVIVTNSATSALGTNSSNEASNSSYLNWSTNTWTGTYEQNNYQYVIVSLQTDDAGGTLYFDFSPDGTNTNTFPVAGFEVASTTHEIHTAVKSSRYFRARYVGSGTRTYFRLYTYYTNSNLQLNSPLNQSMTSDSDGLIVKSAYVVQAYPTLSSVAEGDFDTPSITNHREIRTRDQRHVHFQECDDYTEFTALGNDTANLANSANHIAGTNAITFDKVNGAANTVFAGVYTTTLDASSTNIEGIFEEGAFVSACVYIPDITNVNYVFIRYGTDGSNYNEWQFSVADLTAAKWLQLRKSVSTPDTYAGNGWNTSAVSFVSFGVAFNSETDTLAGIIFDSVGFVAGRVTDSTTNTSVSSSVNTPNINIQRIAGTVATQYVGSAFADGTSNSQSFQRTAANMKYYNGTTWDRARGDTTNGLLVNLGSNNDVTVTGSLTSAGNVTNAGTFAVQVSSALPSGTNAIGKLAANSGVDIGDVDITSISTGTNAIGRVGHDITGIGHGVTTVTTAGTDVVLAGSTACKRAIIQSQTDNTGLIAVGASGVDATVATGTGIILYPGDSIEIDIDNLADIYIDSTVNGEGVRYTYFT